MTAVSYLATVAPHRPNGGRDADPQHTCRAGHPLTSDNAYQHPDGGRVRCRTCSAIQQRARRRTARPAHQPTLAPYPDYDNTAHCRAVGIDMTPDIDLRGRPTITSRLAHEDAVALAKQVCHGCPFLQPCRDYALDHPDETGVWGGLDETQRRRIRPRRGGRPVERRP